MLFISGQLGVDPEKGTLVEGGTGAQTRQALANIQAILDEAGFAKQEVVQVQVFLADLGDYKVMNEAYAAFFDNHAPSRAAFEVARLPLDGRVEIMVTAVRAE